MYKKIDIFDFDGTLIYTPDFYEGKEIWEKKMGRVCPYNGWASKAESLDLDVFYMALNPYVYAKYLESFNDSETFTALVTGRLARLIEPVTAILDFHGLEFNLIALNNAGTTYSFKTNLFTNLINEHNPEVITIYDDRHRHIVDFEKQWAPLQNCGVEIIDVTKTDKAPKIIYN